MDILIKLAPASVATALANIVLPVPGGPNSKSPLHGCDNARSVNMKLQRLFRNLVDCINFSQVNTSLYQKGNDKSSGESELYCSAAVLQIRDSKLDMDKQVTRVFKI